MKLYIYLIAFFFCESLYAQDLHFSHVFNTNILTNPGKTGLIYGNQRAILSYRDQWTVAKSPFKSYFVAADAVFGKPRKANFGVGVYAFRDLAGDLKVGNTQGMISLSSIIPTSKNSMLSLGIQGGYSQQSIKTGGMMWDAQYSNGAYNAGASANESISFSPFGYFDFNAGIVYYFNTKNPYNMGLNSTQSREIEIGVAVHHLLEPKFQFGDTEKSNLYRKYMAHFNGIFNIKNTNYAINPALLYARQGPYQEIGAGLMVRYTLKEQSKHTEFSKDMSFSVGGYYRYLDAFVPSVFFEYHKYSIGATFGLNHSDLRKATKSFSGYEIVLRFINF